MPDLTLLDASRLSFSASCCRQNWIRRNNASRTKALGTQLKKLGKQCEDDFGHRWSHLADASEEYQAQRILSPTAVVVYGRLLDMVQNPWKI
jgi:hypothetical protein